MNIFYLICVFFYFISSITDGINVIDASAPRFKHSTRRNHYIYLGDSVKFKCLAVGRPAPKVHWYRNDLYLNYSYMHNVKRYSENEQQMSLEIKDIQLGDKGEWRCRVWNPEGSITRNFSLHIIDFCDYFFNSNHTAAEVPLECACQWKMLNIFRRDVDFSVISDNVCLRFKTDNENVIVHRRPMCLNAPCTPTLNYEKIVFNPDLKTTLLYKDIDRLNHVWDTSDNTIGSDLQSPSNVPNEQLRVVPKIASGPKILEFDAKIQDMRAIMKNRPSVANSNSSETHAESRENFDSVQIDIDGKNVDINEQVLETTTGEPKMGNEIDKSGSETHHESSVEENTAPPQVETTTRGGWWPGPKRMENLAPYFTQAVYHRTEPIISTSGRTIKLSCRAKGFPLPHITWHKDNSELKIDSERYAASKYQFNNYNLEMEDAVESDSGHYTCEVYNKHGTIKRDFEVRIVDRTRSKPVIVPNVLINQTVDVNSTVNFTCKVISDNLPYFMWARLHQINGSYINYTNPKQPEFNLFDAQYVPESSGLMVINQRIKIFRDTRKSVLSIVNVSLKDQGIYSCIIGNSLGTTMANATLTVNEFRPKTLPTDPIAPPQDFQFILFIGLIFLAIAILTAALTYVVYQRRQAKNRIQNLDKMEVFKKVIITKKTPQAGEIWPDLVSSYEITIESVVRKHDMDSSLPDDFSKRYEVPTDPKWEIDRKKIKIENKIGEGAFGEVWQASLQLTEAGTESMKVAVKQLKENAGDKELKILVGEMQIFKSIGEHKNVLKLIGCCTGIGDLYVVLELCPYGNLRTFLQSHRPLDQIPDVEAAVEGSVNYVQTDTLALQPVCRSTECGNKRLMLRDLIRFAAEIARGMEFLASKCIIHRDLAARNVLVAEKFVMKISDFGLSRNVLNNDYYRKRGDGDLPIKWMAPESLDEENHIYTTMSDVWSYGIIVWEIMTLGAQPYRTIPFAALYDWLMAGNRLDPPASCPVEIHSMMTKCWQQTPENRPTFTTISDYLEAILNSAAKYHDELPSDSSFQPSDTEDESKNVIYNNPVSRKAPKMLRTSVAIFDEFINNQEYQNIHNMGEDAPLLEQQTPEKPPRKRITLFNTEPYYFNVSHQDQRANRFFDNTVNDTDSDALISDTSRRSSDVNQQAYVNHHDYVNDRNSSKNSEYANNTASAVQHKRLSDASAFDLELGNLIYSSPPSKKSSVSNLSVSVNQPPIQLSRSSSKNNFSQRSYSTESQASSGRGGSSAMSSAEGIGGLADLCQIEYAVINAPLQSTNDMLHNNKDKTKKNHMI